MNTTVFSMNPPSRLSAEYFVYLEAAFGHQFPCLPLVLRALFFMVIASTGILLNFVVIFVTYKSKSLRGTANFLLALTSFFEILHQHGHFLSIFLAFSGQNFIQIQLGVRICTLALFGNSGIGLLLMFTAVDRLLVIIFPIWHATMNKFIYLGTMTAITVLFSAFLVFSIYFSASLIPSDINVTGIMADLFQGVSAGFSVLSTLCFNLLTIIIYAIVGIKLHYHHSGQNSQTEQNNKRIFRSLLAIVSINIGGYLLQTIYYVFLLLVVNQGSGSRTGSVSLSVISIWTWEQLLGIPLNLSAASNAPILYYISTEYRAAFHKHFKWLFKFVNKEATVAPTTINNNNNCIRIVVAANSPFTGFNYENR